MSANVRLAVPNKGRLEEPAASLLRRAGVSHERTSRALSVPVRNVDLELLFVHSEDVCELVADGVATLGITGFDLLAESGTELRVAAELDFGRCSLTAAVPVASPVEDISEFEGLRVGTAHPVTTDAFFAEKGIDVTTVPLHGSIEVAPKLDIADAIVDLVSSGSTMLVNGLRQVATLLESEAVLVVDNDPTVERRTNQIVTMLRAVVVARRKRYVLMNAPRDALRLIEDIIPGLEAPSIMPLGHDEGMFAVHSVVDADDMWQVLPRLKQAGATGILVLPIESLIA